jgi:Tfp pilus assembly protein PilX
MQKTAGTKKRVALPGQDEAFRKADAALKEAERLVKDAHAHYCKAMEYKARCEMEYQNVSVTVTVFS